MTKLVETEIPDWAEWMAQDLSGHWIAYERKPEPSRTYQWWDGGGGGAVTCGYSGKENPDWRSTLHKLEEK